MMRYQRVSPDCLPLANGRKSNPRTCKEEEADNGRLAAYTSNGGSGGGFDGKSLRFRPGTSPSSAASQDQNFTSPLAASDSPQSDSPHHHPSRATNEGGGNGSPGGDVILQWGHNKRSRGSRAESRIAAIAAYGGDESSSQVRPVIKIHRRTVVGGGGEKLNAMPPPCGSGSYSRGTNLRPAMPVRDHHHSGSLLNRTTADDHRAATASPSRAYNGSGPRAHPHRTTAASSAPAEKRSSSSPDKPDPHHHTTTTTTNNTNYHHNNNNNNSKPSTNNESKSAAAAASETATPQSETAGGAVEKVSLEAFEWPRIYISLSRKEKEDDFLVMKGTKLPQRPKKRAKNVDKTLQYCFPGMWLSDLTRGRYEVREKKCVKKRRRGLKGMESMDSESE